MQQNNFASLWKKHALFYGTVFGIVSPLIMIWPPDDLVGMSWQMWVISFLLVIAAVGLFLAPLFAIADIASGKIRGRLDRGTTKKRNVRTRPLYHILYGVLYYLISYFFFRDDTYWLSSFVMWSLRTLSVLSILFGLLIGLLILMGLMEDKDFENHDQKPRA